MGQGNRKRALCGQPAQRSIGIGDECRWKGSSGAVGEGRCGDVGGCGPIFFIPSPVILAGG